MVFRGCVKVLSVLGWLIMPSLGGPNWVTQTSVLASALGATTARNTVVLRKIVSYGYAVL